MKRRIIAVFVIFLCASIVWLSMGAVLMQRTHQQDSKLRSQVSDLWGKPQAQKAPKAYYKTSKLPIRHPLALSSNNIAVDLKLEPRKRGLLWYATYTVTLDAGYTVANPTDAPVDTFFEYDLPKAGAATYNLEATVDGKKVEKPVLTVDAVKIRIPLGPHEKRKVGVKYVSQGIDRWTYSSRAGMKQVVDFNLTMNTNFDRIDFPETSISPNKKERTDKGWKLGWKYNSLMTGVEIGMIMPKNVNPGPTVTQVTFWAPVSLFMFFFLLTMLTTARGIRVHPVSYIFIAAAFFSFHLLLAYLAGHMSLYASFVIASVVSTALVVSYMKLVVGPRFAYREVALSQFIYLVLFSYSFFFKGYRGLSITVLCVVTLFIAMQVTGRVDWDSVLAKEDIEESPVPR